MSLVLGGGLGRRLKRIFVWLAKTVLSAFVRYRRWPVQHRRRTQGRGFSATQYNYVEFASRTGSIPPVSAAVWLLVFVVSWLLVFWVSDYYACKVQSEKPVTLKGLLGSKRSLSSARVDIPSRHLIVRAAYLDRRPRHGYINVTVFLVEIHKDLLANNSIVACAAGTSVSFQLNVQMARNSRWSHREFPLLSHDVAIVDCFGLAAVRSGARAFLWYTRSDDLYRVESEQSYFIPRTKKTFNDDDVKIVLCMGIVRDVPSFMNEFLRYSKHLGVDHVYMTGEDSFIRNGGFQQDSFVRKAISDNYISFTFWHQWLRTDEMFYHSQMLAHEDCIYRFQGTYDYAFIVDSDDFFVPRVPKENKLDFYVEKYCRFGSCAFAWVEYYPDCGLDWSKLGDHGNVTNTLTSLVSNRRITAGKSIHKLSAVIDAGTHESQKLLKGFQRISVPPTYAYVAHVRRELTPQGGLDSC